MQDDATWDSPGDPGVRALCFHRRGHGLDPWSGIEDPHTMRHSKQKEVPRESSRSLLLKVRSPSTSSRGAWKPDRKAESWAQPRAAESDAIDEILQVTRAPPSFSSDAGLRKDRVLNGTVLPPQRSGNTRFLCPTRQSTP